jgi:hypothetical protein
LLRAFFDESGIHAGSPATVVSGFMGSRAQWRSVGVKWRKATDGKVFHYKDMRLEKELIENLSSILAESKLQVVSGAFTGNWDRAITSGAPDWSTRFPSCYHMVFELCVQQMSRYAVEHWNDEPVSVVFSRQDNYAKRAEEVWRTYQGNGMWRHIASFAYGDPKQFLELQAADMIAYETFQCLKEGAAGGWAWDDWPLMRKLLRNDSLMHGRHQTEDQFVKMMRDQDKNRIYLKSVAPKPQGRRAK